MIIALGIAAFVFIVLLSLGLCWAAARGDRQLAQAREDLKGPADRRRIGL